MPPFLLFDIDGVVRDVSGSYRRALADTVEQFTAGAYRPNATEIDQLKGEGLWNNDWEASQEMVYRYFERLGQPRSQQPLNYGEIVAFFQSRYRGVEPENPDHWTGYICQEPLLLTADYLAQLTDAGILWGFFSGATRGSATYVLERRLGLRSPVLIAMEDAPGKPDPSGLFAAIDQLATQHQVTPTTVIYVGDTVADMYTVEQARKKARSHPSQATVQSWLGVGILPPHVQTSSEYASSYALNLQQAGAAIVLDTVMALDPPQIQQLFISATSERNETRKRSDD